MKNIRIVIFLLLLLIATLLSLIGRCFYLQYLKKQHYSSLTLNQQPQKPQRGTILDRQGRVLAASNKVQIVFAEPRTIDNHRETAAKLAPLLAMNEDEIYLLITKSKNPGFAKIKVGADAGQCQAVSKIYGIGVIDDWVRYYPMGNITSHVVGFTSDDNQGFGGVELQYEKELNGTEGQNIFFADAFRRPIRLKTQESILTDGAGIILTIDAAIQQFAHEELMKQYKLYQAESAVAIVAEPKTGAILALVSLPDFDPNDPGKEKIDHLRDRAINDQFEPGSIIKPVIVAIALDSGGLGLKDVIYCENGLYHGKGFGTISEYGGHQYGNMTVREILIESSNIGMAKIGQKIGKNKLYNGLKMFGFGKKTGIELPGEAGGTLWPPQNWTGYSITRVPFGQEISVTTMQLIRAFCIIANGGRSVRPHIVSAMVDTEGRIIELRQPASNVGFVIKPETAKWLVTDALTGVVNEGTGKKAKLEKWQVFGKTGTANMAKSNHRGYEDDAYIASFIAGAPAEDPAVVVLVSVRRPNVHLGKGYTGGAVASPVVGAIIDKTLNYLKIHPLK